MINEVIYFSNNRNWVIGGIARETIIFRSPQPKITYLPNTKLDQFSLSMFFNSHVRRNFSNVLFLGASTFFTILKKRPSANFNGARVFFTHLIPEGAPDEAQVVGLNSLDKIFTMNESSRVILQNVGVKTTIEVVYGAIDSTVFYPSSTEPLPEAFVLITSHAAARKRPEMILDFIRSVPEIQFLIHGKHWLNFEVKDINNLEIREFSLTNQPDLIRKASVLLSMSWVEGGPFPILEALSSGTPVVSTSTGFATDLINSSNGRLIENVEDFQEIELLIKECIKLKTSVRHMNLLPKPLTWDVLSQHFYS
jgi:glycosyltransferase involved in cell wall biosynthesis